MLWLTVYTYPTGIDPLVYMTHDLFDSVGVSRHFVWKSRCDPAVLFAAMVRIGYLSSAGADEDASLVFGLVNHFV